MKKIIARYILVIAVLLMGGMSVFAQDFSRTIEVVGVGVAYGEPDMATVEVGVDIRDVEFAVAFETANSIMETVFAQTIDLGIPAEDIQTTAINVWFEENYDPQSNTSTGDRIYHVTQSIRIVVRDTAQISNVITTAVDHGANQIYGLNFTFSDTDLLETEAREIAVEDAKARAQHLAELMGVELGEVLSIVEVGSGSGMPPMGGRGGFDVMESAVVAPGQLSLATSLRMTFAIK